MAASQPTANSAGTKAITKPTQITARGSDFSFMPQPPVQQTSGCRFCDSEYTAGNQTGNRLFVAGAGGDFEDSEEGFLRDIHATDALHALLAFLLFFEELALARDIAAVAFGEHVLANGADRLAGDDTAADGGLNGHLEHLPRNQFPQAGDQLAAALVGLLAMADDRERVHRFAAHQHVELDEVRLAVTRKMIIERGIAARDALQAVVKIKDDFVERQFVGEHNARGRQIFELLLHAALFLAQLQNAADGFLRRDDHRREDRLFDFLD